MWQFGVGWGARRPGWTMMNFLRLMSVLIVLIACHLAAPGQLAAQGPSKEILEMIATAGRLPAAQRPEAGKKAVARAQELKDRQGEAQALLWTALCLSNLSRFQEALDLDNLALPIYRESGSRKGEATSLNNIGAVYHSLGQEKRALEFYNQALPIRREVGDRNGEETSLNNIGGSCSILGMKHKALELFDQALAIERKGGDRRAEGITLNNIGGVYDSLSQAQKALDFYNKSLTIEHKLGDPVAEASTLNNLGGDYDDLGQQPKALGFYDQALAIERKAGDRDGEASSLSGIGRLFLRLGQAEKALDLCNQARAILLDIGNRSGMATALNNIGTVYESLGQDLKALEFYNQALPIRREVGDRNGEAASLNNIGVVYWTLGQVPKALDFYNQALSIEREVGNRGGEATTLSSIGVAYRDSGEQLKAVDFLNQALPIEGEVGNSRMEAVTLGALGLAYSNLGQKQNALLSYSKGFPIAHQVGDRSTEAVALWRLGDFFDGENQADDAALILKQAVNVYQSLRADIAGLDIESQKSFKESVAGAYRDLAKVLIEQGRLGEAERVMALLKDDERFEFLRRDPAVKTISERVESVGKEQGWLDRWSVIRDKAVVIGTRISDLKQAKAEAQREGVAFTDEKKLAGLESDEEVVGKAMTAFYQEVDSEASEQRTLIAANQKKELEEFRKDVGGPLDELQVATNTKVAAIFALSNQNSVDFIVATPEGASPISISIDQAKVNSLVSDFRTALTHPGIDPKAPGLALYNLVFKKVIDQLKSAGISHVMWTLDGSLRYIPLPAVWDGEHY